MSTPKPMMSDAQLRRRRKLQGNIGRTTSTLGLAGAGLGTAAAIASKKPGALKAVPGLKRATAGGLKDTALYTGIAAGGIGGVGGFNAASIYSDEARRKKQTQLKKELGMDVGYYGEEGIAKAWSPVAGNFDSEANREKRQKVYQGGALTSAGAAGAYAAHHGMHAVHEARNIKPVQATQIPKGHKPGQALGRRFQALDVKPLKAVGRRGSKAAMGVAAVAGAAGVHSALKRKERGSWQPYAKRDSVSAFGVNHAEEVAKAINIKPENKGKFTALAHKKGKGVQEAAHSIVHSSKATELQRKRAQFAINAKKWHHK